jgi:uncharacterized protein involved in outer membrane biogenesis
MKKKLIIVALALVVIVVVALVAVGSSLDKIIKQAVEKGGPAITKVDVKLDSVSLSLLNGEGALHGFSLGNPDGYTSSNSIEFALASLSLKPSSLMSDKVVIRHVRLDGPVITFEGSLLKDNNLKDLVKGMQSGQEAADEDAAEPEEEEGKEAASRKLQVDEFSLTGATLHAIVKELGGETNTFVLPNIILTDLGTGPEGITAGELSKLVVMAVTQEALQALINSDASLEKMGDAALKSLDESGNEDTSKAVRGVMDLLKKKQ